MESQPLAVPGTVGRAYMARDVAREGCRKPQVHPEFDRLIGFVILLGHVSIDCCEESKYPVTLRNAGKSSD